MTGYFITILSVVFLLWIYSKILDWVNNNFF